MICMHEAKKRNRADINDQEDSHKINHFGIRISNLQKWQEKIKRYNLNPIYVKYRYSSSWYITDPNGHGIEVSWTEKPTLYFPPLKNSILKK